MATVQRRIGFEFETNAFVAQDMGNYKVLIDDEKRIYQQGNWKAVSDSGRIEFVSDPLDNADAAQTSLRQITEFINNSIKDVNTNIRPGTNGTWDTANLGNRAVHVARDVNMTQDVNRIAFYGNPQISVGVQSNRLATFLSKIRTKQPVRSLRRRLHQDFANKIARDDALKARVGNIGKLLGGQEIKKTSKIRGRVSELIKRHATGINSDRLRGLWTLMAIYWEDVTRYTGAGYIKAKFPVLARTDFHSMYNDLSVQEKNAFALGRHDFLNPLFIGGRVNLEHITLVHGQNITPGIWYDSINNPVSQRTFSGVLHDVDLMSDENRVATGTSKSMGQMPLDTTGGGHRVVLELRHITGGLNIPINTMFDHVIKPIWQFILNIRG